MADAGVVQETTKEEIKTTQEEISSSTPSVQEPEPETSAPVPQEQTVTSVTEKITVTKKETKAQPPPAPAKPAMTTQAASSTRTHVKSSSVREYTDTSTLLSDLSRDYRGTSPAVLESIATHPALYSHKYLVERMRPSLSARSRKVIRDAEDLAIATPGLKHMLEVQYPFLFVCLCFCFRFYVCQTVFCFGCGLL